MLKQHVATLQKQNHWQHLRSSPCQDEKKKVKITNIHCFFFDAIEKILGKFYRMDDPLFDIENYRLYHM